MHGLWFYPGVGGVSKSRPGIFDTDSKILTIAMTNPKILIPLIRQKIPHILAQQITGVQPMGSGSGSIFSQRMRFSSKVYNRKHWPYQYWISVHNMTEAERWCWARFPGRYWHSDYEQFVFKRRKDAALFALRWS